MKIRVLLTAVALLLSACPTTDPAPEDAPPDCAASTTCDTCTRVNGCGWCGNQVAGNCIAGSRAAGDDGTCPNNTWFWFPQECSAPPELSHDAALGEDCGLHATCGACTGQLSCGWCADLQQCMPGSAGGPFLISCAQWSWTASMCVGGEGGSSSSSGGPVRDCVQPGAAAGASCEMNTDCCSNYCLGCVCQPPPRFDECGAGPCAPGACSTEATCQCIPDGVPCSTGDQCCSRLCEGVCRPTEQAGLGGECVDNRECESSRCVNGRCAEPMCGPCFPFGSTPFPGVRCCSNVVDSDGACRCLTSGSSCSAHEECCDTHCVDGVCR